MVEVDEQPERNGRHLHKIRDREESRAREQDHNSRREQGLEEKAKAESNLYVDYSGYSEDHDFVRNSRAKDRRSRPRAYARTISPATATSTPYQQAQSMNAAMVRDMTNNGGPRNAQQLMQARFIQH